MFEFAMRTEKEKGNIASAVRSKHGFARRENHTGIPTQLKERIEQSTGLSFDDVRVHYNSNLPARLDALAYTQGNQVEIGPGQERHLPHELGHVVQQKLGAVRANAMHSSGAALNTDARLEQQADEIGAGKKVAIVQRMGDNVVQRCGGGEDADLLKPDGTFESGVLEARYQAYVARKKPGENIRDRLNWKEASDSFARIRAQGSAFEDEQVRKFRQTARDVEEQITIVTNFSNTRIRVDAIGYDRQTGDIIIQEYKSSATAPYTPNQTTGYPELQQCGGAVAGKGKGKFHGGVQIPAGTQVMTIRPG